MSASRVLITAGAALVIVPVSLFSSLLAYFGYLRLRNAWRYKKSGCNIPKRKEKFLLGSGIDHYHLTDYGMGPVFYSTALHVAQISVCDPDIVQYVLQEANFPRSPLSANTGRVTGQSLLTMQHANNGPWHKERRLMEPAFKKSYIRAVNHVFEEYARAFTAKIISDNEKNPERSLEFLTEISKVVVDIISASGFNNPLSNTETAELNPFIVAMKGLFKGLNSPLYILPFGPVIVRWLMRKDFQVMEDVFYKVIDERLQEETDGKKEKKERVPDLLDMLMKPDAEGNKLNRTQLRNELLLLYIAGHETTSTAVSWLIYFLAKNPDVEEKVLEEIDRVLGPSDGETLVAPTEEQVDELVYLKMALKESLRFYPPIIPLSRVVAETFEYKGYIFPKGAIVRCCNYLIQHNPDIYPDPEKFEPERFSKENSSGRHMGTFFPFGLGPRICLGRNFFFAEATVILATLLREVRFVLDPSKVSGEKVPVFSTLKPNAVWVIPQRRFQKTN